MKKSEARMKELEDARFKELEKYGKPDGDTDQHTLDMSNAAYEGSVGSGIESVQVLTMPERDAAIELCGTHRKTTKGRAPPRGAPPLPAIFLLCGIYPNQADTIHKNVKV